jgi:hypothetical protein
VTHHNMSVTSALCDSGENLPNQTVKRLTRLIAVDRSLFDPFPQSYRVRSTEDGRT